MSDLLQEAEACALKIGLHRNSRVPIDVRDDCLSAEDMIRHLIARVRELEAKNKRLRHAAREALPYVEQAYDYSFPDLAENSRIAGDIRAALGETARSRKETTHE